MKGTPAATSNQPNAAGAAGVRIDGVVWATANVSIRGRFADKPGDYGMLYTFEEAQTACPSGWRLPTKTELEALSNYSREVKENGVKGKRYIKGDNSVFFPAAGYRTDGIVEQRGVNGEYWSSTPYNGPTNNPGGRPMAYSLEIFPVWEIACVSTQYKDIGLAVRCVRK